MCAVTTAASTPPSGPGNSPSRHSLRCLHLLSISATIQVSAYVPRSVRGVFRLQLVGAAVAAAITQVADTNKVNSQLSACNISLSDWLHLLGRARWWTRSEVVGCCWPPQSYVFKRQTVGRNYHRFTSEWIRLLFAGVFGMMEITTFRTVECAIMRGVIYFCNLLLRALENAIC